MLKRWFAVTLWKRILIALVLGAVAGTLLGEQAEYIKWVGDAFVRLIRMIVVPLIFLTLVSGVVAMGDPKRLGTLGVKTIALYMGTTAAAIVLGMFFATLLQPGVGIDLSSTTPAALSDAKTLSERLLGIIPSNPAEALAKGDVLAIIFFSILLGIGIMMAGDKGRPLAKLFDSGSDAILNVTHLVMEVAPFGVFALIAFVTGTKGIGALVDVIWLVLAVLLASIAQILIVYCGIIKLGLKLSPLTFIRGALDAQMVAFSTSSSNATLPVTMTVAEENLGIKKQVASSVLPLGATINMDGTALYVGILAIFSAQIFGVSLDLADYLLIALTTTLVSIGTAGVPSASLFLLAAVLSAIGIGPAETALVVGFVLPFDRPLDMTRTLLNVTSDLTVATAVAKWEGTLDEDVFNADNID